MTSSLAEAHPHRDQVDEGHSVVIDAPQRHDAYGVHHDHDDSDEVEEAGAQVQAEQQAAHHEGGQQTQGDVEESLWHYRQILLVKHIRHPEKKKGQLCKIAVSAKTSFSRGGVLGIHTCKERLQSQGRCHLFVSFPW